MEPLKFLPFSCDPRKVASRKVPSKEFPRKNLEYHFFMTTEGKSGRLLDFLSWNNPLWVVLGVTGDALPLQGKR